MSLPPEVVDDLLAQEVTDLRKPSYLQWYLLKHYHATTKRPPWWKLRARRRWDYEARWLEKHNPQKS